MMAHRDFPPYQAVDFSLRLLLRRLPPSRWTEHLALWWGSRFQAGTRVIRLRNGCRMRVEPRDFLLTSLYYLGTFEPHCLRLLPRLLSPGSTMLDIGANIGVYTLAAARLVGPQGRVIAIEPLPAHVTTLRAHLALNTFSWVTVVATAVGSQDGHATIGLPRGGNSGMYTLTDSDDASDTFRVPLMRLDRILEETGVDRVHLVKMDIEGAEDEALRGATDLLARHRPAFIIELNEAALQARGSHTEQVRSIFHQADYVGWLIKPRGLEPIGTLGDRDCIECLFLPEERAHLVRGWVRRRDTMRQAVVHQREGHASAPAQTLDHS